MAKVDMNLTPNGGTMQMPFLIVYKQGAQWRVSNSPDIPRSLDEGEDHLGVLDAIQEWMGKMDALRDPRGLLTFEVESHITGVDSTYSADFDSNMLEHTVKVSSSWRWK